MITVEMTFFRNPNFCFCFLHSRCIETGWVRSRRCLSLLRTVGVKKCELNVWTCFHQLICLAEIFYQIFLPPALIWNINSNRFDLKESIAFNVQIEWTIQSEFKFNSNFQFQKKMNRWNRCKNEKQTNTSQFLSFFSSVTRKKIKTKTKTTHKTHKWSKSLSFETVDFPFHRLMKRKPSRKTKKQMKILK